MACARLRSAGCDASGTCRVFRRDPPPVHSPGMTRIEIELYAERLSRHAERLRDDLDGARMRLARKPSALARELLRDFPKGKRRRGGRRRRRRGGGDSDGARADRAKGPSKAEPDESAPADDDAEEPAAA